MSEAAALAHAAHLALGTVASTTGLEPLVANRAFRRMEQQIFACNYPNAMAEDFAVWAEEAMAKILSAEDIKPLCPFIVAAWFGREVLYWLRGSFDD
jgi:hypothetical protein